MENLRWILIFAGVAILVLLYISGRSSGGRRRDARAEPDPLLGDEPAPRGGRSRRDAHLDGFDVDPEDLQRPGDPVRAPVSRPPPPRRVTAQRRAPVHDFESVLEEDFEPVAEAPAARAAPRRGRRGGEGGRAPVRADAGRAEPVPDDAYDPDGYGGGGYDRDGHDGDGYAPDGYAPDGYDPDGYDPGDGYDGDGHDDGRADASGAEGGAAAALGGLGRRIESIGARFGAGRREASAERERADERPAGPAPTKVVTLHVVSPDGAWFDGALIAETFEARGYAFGEMDIFHSMHRGRIVFSIAKMVEPGRFDPDDLDSFATPGLVMILQLPGPVPGDAAFEVLLAEAHELAARLDARVLDGERSTLSKQSAQHTRDGIREFMHRRKFYGDRAG